MQISDVFYHTLFYNESMNFLSIRLSTVRPELIIPFNVFILVAGSYVCYLKEGDDFDQDRLEHLRNRGLKKFHIKEEEEKKYQEFLTQILDNIHLESNAVKTSLALDVTENSANMVMKNPTSEKSYEMAKSSSNIVQKILGENDAILREIVAHGRSVSTNVADRMHSHMVNTVSIAIKFAETLKSGINMNSLGVAAFYHDVSFTQYSAEDQKLFFKEVKQMVAKELTIYKSHPGKSVEALQDKAFAEKEVLDLIMTHEENISGQGFPNGLTKLTQAQEVLSLCAFYDREVTCVGKDPADVYNSIMIDQLGNYNLELLKNFKKFLKNYL
jgi:HD-GYP domain-containing protein (c-di-GMP phosphodiesterase class II)